jgi:hypothetical protein
MADKGNVLLDYEITDNEMAFIGANRLIKVSNTMLEQVENYLREVRKIVSTYGKAELILALGATAATEMQGLYNRSTAFIEGTAAEIVVPPIEPVV